jgi:hypothetical protein
VKKSRDQNMKYSNFCNCPLRPPPPVTWAHFRCIRFSAVLAAFLFLHQASKHFILVFHLFSTFPAQFLFSKYERDYCLTAIYIGLLYVLYLFIFWKLQNIAIGHC